MLFARTTRTAAVGLCLLTAAACQARASTVDESNGMVNYAQGHRKAAPDLNLPTILHTDGDTFSLRAHKGKVVVINYWASWCPPCRDELPQLDQAATDFQPKNVVFIGVDFHGDGSTPAAAKAFLVGHRVPYDSMFDPQSKTVLQFRGRVTIAAPPITIFVDKQGKIASIVNGVVTYSQLRDTVNKLNAESAG